jgi:threonine dehydratase
MLGPCTPEVTISDIEEARQRIRGIAWRTPLLPASRYDDGKIYLKLECVQRTGSFKIRGAWNKMSRCTRNQLTKGFVTISAGNHGQAVAWCAKRLESACTVYVPEAAVERKVKSIESMGAKIVRRPVSEIMDSMADNRMYQLGMTFVHPFADPYVVAGQGTVGLEILEDLEQVKTVLVPVGGGGLVNGIATALKAKKSGVKVYGVQAEGAAPLPPFLETGKAQDIDEIHTIADGIATTKVFPYMQELFRRNLEGAFTVSDEEIKLAMSHILKESHAVAEPAGASSLAAAAKYRTRLEEPIVCVVSGGNGNPDLLSQLVKS